LNKIVCFEGLFNRRDIVPLFLYSRLIWLSREYLICNYFLILCGEVAPVFIIEFMIQCPFGGMKDLLSLFRGGCLYNLGRNVLVISRDLF